ncbi:MAG TPA: epimerase, partial [Nitrospira sp.]
VYPGPRPLVPLVLQPAHRLMEMMPSTHDAARRLGLVTIQDMLAALIRAIEYPPESIRVIEVPEIRRLGGKG